MSRWFPDVSSDEGLTSALNGGSIAAIFFGFLGLLGFVITLFAGHLPGNDTAMTQAGRIGALVAIGLEALIAFVAAYRFHRRKGMVMGTITLILFLIEWATKLAAGRVGWFVAYILILVGLINGLRGAWVARRSGPLGEADLENVFE